MDGEIALLGCWRVVVNHNQDKLGKVMLSLGRHEEDVSNLTEAEVSALWAVMRRVKAALDACFQPDHYNYAFLMNQDRHVHLHVIPRYRDTRRRMKAEG
jgi:diadenosine tetraphosphate (Ap4A) HIT family hydrolase